MENCGRVSRAVPYRICERKYTLPIRDIRASEKVFYRQELDIYVASIDYDPKVDTIPVNFFPLGGGLCALA